jgi:serine protease
MARYAGVQRCVWAGLTLLVAACFPQHGRDRDRAGDEPATGYGVSGTLRASDHVAVDSDVNDSYAPYVDNDSPPRAQNLVAPVTLGGYLNLPQRGPEGDSRAVGDIIDVFRVELSAGQTITLTTGDDPAKSDLDLLLLDGDMAIVDGSFGVGATESLTLTEQHVAERVFVAVVVCGSTLYHCDPLPDGYVGASTYVLNIGTGAGNASNAQALRLGDAFVPGEVVTTLRERIDVAPPPRALGHAMRAAQRDVRRPQRLRLEANTGATRAGALRAVRRAPDANDPLQSKLDTIMAVKALRRRADVASADLNYLRRPLAVPDDSAYRYQWHYDIINLPQAWDVSTGSSDVVVGVIDTGVLVNHPDLKDKIVAGFDFIDDADNARDGDGMDGNADDPGDLAYATRSTFHGTHVAGTIAAASNNGQGVAGVSWNAKIMPLRVLGKDGGSSYDVMQAVLYAAGLKNDSGTVPARRADVINLSLGGGGYSQTEQDAFLRARAAGVIVVAAAGNSGSSSASYPAAYNGVIAVSAVDSKLARAAYSNYGALIDVAAPGGSMGLDVNKDGQGDGILSTSGSDGSGKIEFTYTFQTGTSMAAPHVAGVIALMKAVKPDLTPDMFDALLVSGALTQDLGNKGRDNDFGYGMIDAYKAVTVASNGQVPTEPVLVAFPSAMNFGTDLTRLTLAVNNGGGGELTAQVATSDAAWLTLEPQLDARGLGSYVVSVDRRGLAIGSYSTTVTLVSDVNTVVVPVYLEVNGQTDLANSLRYQWIVLIDANSGATVAATQAGAGPDGYTYSFSAVAPGDYYVIAGSDLDNDQFICDRGESCGAYADSVEMTPVTVDAADVAGVEVTYAFGSELRLPSSSRYVVPRAGVARAASAAASLSPASRPIPPAR